MDAIDYVPRLIISSYENDKTSLEKTALMIARKIRQTHPDVASQISRIIATSSNNLSSARALDMNPVPVDKDSRFALADIEYPDEHEEPILSKSTKEQLLAFVKERELIEDFINKGVVPPNSLLFDGAPGVGKTMCAYWLASRLSLPIISLNLATALSSYLGQSGQNMHRLFEYARQHRAILFLDEFDAVAKRRDDESDLGELKRLVNVLLKELESFPSHCIVIAATNHPELLDKAIWRRFDRVVEFQLPQEGERKQMLFRQLASWADCVGNDTIEKIAAMTEGLSGADVCKMAEHIKRQIIVEDDEQPSFIAIKEAYRMAPPASADKKKEACYMLKKRFPVLSQSKISEITSVSPATVSRYLKERS
ncbi:AAA family ATPase [Eggerthella sinensis]|uniref:AAA family ATPase n=1 Tax=Eggerthella sinensis TaxID=242230 RepID=UPI001D072FD2|nr:ATP-binding protein [Eggerthella sinensis]MCB7036682.1 ATP-binding protein [Eggerthella sinensis]